MIGAPVIVYLVSVGASMVTEIGMVKVGYKLITYLWHDDGTL